MASPPGTPWWRRVRRRTGPLDTGSRAEDRAAGPAPGTQAPPGSPGLVSILPVLRVPGPALACVTLKAVRRLLGPGPTAPDSRLACAWAHFDALLALGYVCRVGAVQCLLDAASGGPLHAGLFHFYQRVDGLAVLRMAPYQPGITVVRAQRPPTRPGHHLGPADGPGVAAPGCPMPVQPAHAAWELLLGPGHLREDAGGAGPSRMRVADAPLGCLVHLGTDPDSVVQRLARGSDLILVLASDTALHDAGLQLYRVAQAHDLGSDGTGTPHFAARRVAAVHWKRGRLATAWAQLAAPRMDVISVRPGDLPASRPALRPLPRPTRPRADRARSDSVPSLSQGAMDTVRYVPWALVTQPAPGLASADSPAAGGSPTLVPQAAASAVDRPAVASGPADATPRPVRAATGRIWEQVGHYGSAATGLGANRSVAGSPDPDPTTAPAPAAPGRDPAAAAGPIRPGAPSPPGGPAGSVDAGPPARFHRDAIRFRRRVLSAVWADAPPLAWHQATHSLPMPRPVSDPVPPAAGAAGG